MPWAGGATEAPPRSPLCVQLCMQRFYRINTETRINCGCCSIRDRYESFLWEGIFPSHYLCLNSWKTVLAVWACLLQFRTHQNLGFFSEIPPSSSARCAPCLDSWAALQDGLYFSVYPLCSIQVVRCWQRRWCASPVVFFCWTSIMPGAKNWIPHFCEIQFFHIHIGFDQDLGLC